MHIGEGNHIPLMQQCEGITRVRLNWEKLTHYQTDWHIQYRQCKGVINREGRGMEAIRQKPPWECHTSLSLYTMTHINYAEEGNQTHSSLSAMKLGLDSYRTYLIRKYKPSSQTEWTWTSRHQWQRQWTLISRMVTWSHWAGNCSKQNRWCDEIKCLASGTKR